ncbi:hypothetical protein SRABI98_00620 [Microbacterium sp. Bi98]|uniref:AlbA family DNA-binding domain-containing protein n=1 Tax=Microbacterium sp. Bi98 TaxID=2821116 RepID=UPI001D202E5A|nr:ATP-binding protein [Microbacterium sp. Bi98]CAH0144290.1 hypothetical protein SRABI98_00620 [Microbacterium sp. Bi98]
MPPISYDRRREEWIVAGERRDIGDYGDFVLMPEDGTALSASEVAAALRTYAIHWEKSDLVVPVSSVPDGYFKHGPYANVEMRWTDGRITLTFIHLVDILGVTEEVDEEAVAVNLRRVVEPLLGRTRSTLRSIHINDAVAGAELGFDVAIDVHTRGRSVQDLLDIAEHARLLCEALSTGVIERGTLVDLIRGGAGHLLEGQPEGAWLEVKSREYDLSTTRGKISLAQAVTRFCNAESGGTIVIGAETRKDGNGETIRRVRGIPTGPNKVRRHLQVLNSHVYPPPHGLSVEQVEVEDGRVLVLVDVPSQPEELKPFLVHGAILLDGSTEGSFISVVQRRGEGSIPITAPMIHASLAAGRALLRGKRD